MLKIVKDSFVKKNATNVLNAVLDITGAEEKIGSQGPNDKANEKDHEDSIDQKDALILAGGDGYFTDSAKDTQPC